MLDRIGLHFFTKSKTEKFGFFGSDWLTLFRLGYNFTKPKNSNRIVQNQIKKTITLAPPPAPSSFSHPIHPSRRRQPLVPKPLSPSLKPHRDTIYHLRTPTPTLFLSLRTSVCHIFLLIIIC